MNNKIKLSFLIFIIIILLATMSMAKSIGDVTLPNPEITDPGPLMPRHLSFTILNIIQILSIICIPIFLTIGIILIVKKNHKIALGIILIIVPFFIAILIPFIKLLIRLNT